MVAGDVGTIVHVHRGGEAFVVEFMTLDGHTAAIATVLPSQARLVSDKDITHDSRPHDDDHRLIVPAPYYAAAAMPLGSNR